MKAVKFIGCIGNVRIERIFSVYLYNALFEFLSVMLNQKLDMAYVSRLFTINSDGDLPFYKL